MCSIRDTAEVHTSYSCFSIQAIPKTYSRLLILLYSCQGNHDYAVSVTGRKNTETSLSHKTDVIAVKHAEIVTYPSDELLPRYLYSVKAFAGRAPKSVWKVTVGDCPMTH